VLTSLHKNATALIRLILRRLSPGLGVGRSAWRRLTLIARAGVLITLGIVALEAVGVFDRFERLLYDERVAHCQWFMPPSTDRLVHLDIGDPSLEAIGRWPWDRSKLARIIDEIALAGPSAVALDIIFSEKQDASAKREADGSIGELVDHDALLAESLKHLGKALVPASFPFQSEAPPGRFTEVRAALIEDLELTEPEIAAKLAQGADAAEVKSDVEAAFIGARRAAMYVRLRGELSGSPDADLSEAELVRRLLPRTPPGTAGVLARLLATQLPRARSVINLEHLVPTVGQLGTSGGAGVLLPTGAPAGVPIPQFSARAATTGFVDYPPPNDGVVRWATLLLDADGHLYPQFGLSLACISMGVPLTDIQIRPDGIVIPRPDKGPLFVPARVLPRRELSNTRGAIPMGIDLPYTGTSDWKSMYARADDPQGSRQHIEIVKVWDACQTLARIEVNNRQFDGAARAVLGKTLKVDELKAFNAKALPADDWQARVELASRIAKEESQTGDIQNLRDAVKTYEDLEKDPKEHLSDHERSDLDEARRAVKSFDAVQAFTTEAPAMAQQLKDIRAFLKGAFHDKAVLIGFIDTSSTTDTVSTPIHSRCPGVVVHGVLFNAIMTGEVWRHAPAWASLLVAFLVGLATTGLVIVLSPIRALLACVGLAVAYVAANGILLFDYLNIVVDLAAPLVVIALVWSGCTLLTLIAEKRQRALIRQRFRTYVDPRLVEYVEQHPTKAAFDGERREMTVVFTDLVGFTKLTETLGEETIGMLNQLWARVVPVIRRDGYLNKFLGDGIMFFYGAPQNSELHAVHAVRAVLEMRNVMRRFNEEVTVPQNLPSLDLRIGLSTGTMIVGDAGAGAAASDYTVLGDNVNLGSRLEGASKYFGTCNLATARTAELAGDEFLFRPIANIRVVGKQHGVMTCEALGFRADATQQQLHLIQLTRQLVDAHQTEELDECLLVAEEMDKTFGASKLTAIYRDQIQRCRDGLEVFSRAIKLESK
jgi:class 3 adenylate cyclase/CHASE2 domain-containing sensor protein